MSKEQCVNKKLHPYYKTGIYGWFGEEVDDNDYIICPICDEVLSMNYCDYAGEQGYNNKCPKCKQELDYSEIYDFEDTCYFKQLLKIKECKLTDLEAKLAESEKRCRDCKHLNKKIELNIKNKLIAENSELQKQLTEKEQIIEKSQLMLDKILTEIHINCYSGLNIVKFKEMVINDLGGIIIKYNQDKISFAIERLEKVKNAFGLINPKLDKAETIKQYIYYIDNQINELKEDK